ncbi:MAG: S8 family serine peptidase, partial [Candidatus Saelkia tenebricola]|nr:S8 family serine peptidase [Candidatus Saelkia tenebricola]
GYFTTFSLVKAVIYAVDQGAKVINASWGGPPNQAILDAFMYAQEQGVLIIVAAGNWDSNSPSFPSAFGLDNVISVAALGEENEKAFFSNFGSYINVSSPGFNIESTYLGNSRKVMSGTSMAAPSVAGFAGLLYSAFPELDYSEIKLLIEKSADEICTNNGRFDEVLGAGRININSGLKNGKNYIALKNIFHLLQEGRAEAERQGLNDLLQELTGSVVLKDELRQIIEIGISPEKIQYQMLKAVWDSEERESFAAAVSMLIEKMLPEDVAGWLLEDNKLSEESELPLILSFNADYLVEIMSNLNQDLQIEVVKNVNSVRQLMQLSDYLTNNEPQIWSNIIENRSVFERSKSMVLAEYDRIFVKGEDVDINKFLLGINPVVQEAFKYLAAYRDISSELSRFSEDIRFVNISGQVIDAAGNPINGAFLKVSPENQEEVDISGLTGFVDVLKTKFSHQYELYREQVELDGTFIINTVPVKAEQNNLMLDCYVLTADGYKKKTVTVNLQGGNEDIVIEMDVDNVVTPKEYVRSKLELFINRELNEDLEADMQILEELLNEFISAQRVVEFNSPLGDDYDFIPEEGVKRIDGVFEHMELLRPLIEDLYGHEFDLFDSVQKELMFAMVNYINRGDSLSEIEQDFRIIQQLKPAFESVLRKKISEINYQGWNFSSIDFWLEKVKNNIKYNSMSLDEAVETVDSLIKKIVPYMRYFPESIGHSSIESSVIFVDSKKEAEEFYSRDFNLDNEEDLNIVVRFYEFNRVLSLGNGDYHELNAGELVEFQDVCFNTGLEILQIDDSVYLKFLFDKIEDFQERYLNREIDYSNTEDLKNLFYWDKIAYYIETVETAKVAIPMIPLVEELYDKAFGEEFDVERRALELVIFARNYSDIKQSLSGEEFDPDNQSHVDFFRRVFLALRGNCSSNLPEMADFILYVERMFGGEILFNDIWEHGVRFARIRNNLNDLEQYLGRRLDLDQEQDFIVGRDWTVLDKIASELDQKIRLWELKSKVEIIEGRKLDFSGFFQEPPQDLMLLKSYYSSRESAVDFIEEYLGRVFSEDEELDIAIWRDWAQLDLSGIKEEDIRIELFDKYINAKADEYIEQVVQQVLNTTESREDIIAAIEWLGDISAEAAVDALIQLLDQQDYYIKSEAIQSLGKIGNAEAAEPLIAKIEEYSDVTLLMQIAEALGEIGDVRAAEPLRESILDLENNSLSLRKAFKDALFKIIDQDTINDFDRALIDLRAGDEDERTQAAEILGETGGAEAIEYLIAALNDESGRVRGIIPWAIKDMGEEAIDVCILNITDEDWRIREGIVEALGYIGHIRGVEPVLDRVLNDLNEEVRIRAAESLG